MPKLGNVHIVPINDLIDHEPANNCICGPILEPILKRNGTVCWLITHHSLDGRELNEEADRHEEPHA